MGKCRYKHEVAVLEPSEDTTVDTGMVQVNMAETSVNSPYLVDKILIDGGSNEIIRPNRPDLWKEIIAGNGTKKVEMKLARGTQRTWGNDGQW